MNYNVAGDVMNAIEIKQVSKNFGGKPVLKALDLTIRAGEFYALLGANGAGKTTLLNIIVGLLQADAGDVMVWGSSLQNNPIEAKQQMAFVPDEPLLYGRLRALEYLEFIAALWGIDGKTAATRAGVILDWLGLTDKMGEPIENYSRGMKQRLSLAGALIHQPKVLILDEPLTGLDPLASRQVKNLLKRYVAEGNTILLTSHVLEVVEKLADRIGTLVDGRLLAEGTLEQLQHNAKQGDASLEQIFLELMNADE
jgi:ABC-2 type transport system ATP-binding protein